MGYDHVKVVIYQSSQLRKMSQLLTVRRTVVVVVQLPGIGPHQQAENEAESRLVKSLVCVKSPYSK